MKNIFKYIYNFPLISKEAALLHENRAREFEWESVKSFITPNSNFLDIGCAKCYSMNRARKELQCNVTGVEPLSKYFNGTDGCKYIYEDFEIYNALAEKLPFKDNQFDVIFCSHVLEHITDLKQSFLEINRVLKNDGIIIFGLPTQTMVFINLFTQWLFTTHFKITNYFFHKILKTTKPKFIEIFVPVSHSYDNKTIIYDLVNYRISKWKKNISNEYKIFKIIKPCLYPYHEYRQVFKINKNKYFSSSVFFICSKKSV